MKKLTEADFRFIHKAAGGVVRRRGLAGAEIALTNPYLFSLYVPVANGEEKVAEACNELFHELGVLPRERVLPLGECGDYCSLAYDDEGVDVIAQFNHPRAMGFEPDDEEYKYTLKGIVCAAEAAARAEEAAMKALVEGIKDGRLKAKSDDGYLVLAGQFYDAIEAGEKRIEYRDFTEYNLKRTLGIKTIRFNRGYGSKGRPPKQMQWEVRKVLLLNDDGRKCDPRRVPDGFCPTTIAVCLGRRLS